jgi:hypothetical protein
MKLNEVSQRRNSMLKKCFTTAVTVFTILSLSVAAMAQFGRGLGQGQPLSNVAAKTALLGYVDGVNLERGKGMPTITLLQNDGEKITVIVSPFWAIANSGFEVKAGQNMSILALPATQLENTYFAAELQNLTTGKVLTLRNDAGFPTVGRGGRGMRGAGATAGTGICPCCPAAN